MKPWLNVSEAAEYAGVSRDTIYTACERHELDHVRVSGRRAIRLKPAWIDAWLEQHARRTDDNHALGARRSIVPTEGGDRGVCTSSVNTRGAPATAASMSGGPASAKLA